MKKLTKYKAEDGTEFDYEYECVDYEKLCYDVALIMSAFPNPPENDGCSFANSGRYLQFRKFGLVLHGAYLGKDCNEGSETVNRVLEDCPLHTQQTKLKDPDNVFVKVNLDGTEEVVENPYKETNEGN